VGNRGGEDDGAGTNGEVNRRRLGLEKRRGVGWVRGRARAREGGRGQERRRAGTCFFRARDRRQAADREVTVAQGIAGVGTQT